MANSTINRPPTLFNCQKPSPLFVWCACRSWRVSRTVCYVPFYNAHSVPTSRTFCNPLISLNNSLIDNRLCVRTSSNICTVICDNRLHIFRFANDITQLHAYKYLDPKYKFLYRFTWVHTQRMLTIGPSERITTCADHTYVHLGPWLVPLWNGMI